MQRFDPSLSRLDTIMAATLYLMSQHQRAACPHLALCVARHLECMARHPDAAPVMREVCLSLYPSWAKAGGLPELSGTLQ